MRIQKSADKYGIKVHVVGSRGDGTSTEGSDYDYLLDEDGSNSKMRKRARKELPKGLDGGEIDRNGEGTGIDVFRDILDGNKPYNTFTPRGEIND